MITAVQFKRRVANICVFAIVISKFGYWWKLCSIILFKVNKCLKVYFYYAVMVFDFAISLRIKRGRKQLFDTKKVA